MRIASSTSSAAFSSGDLADLLQVVLDRVGGGAGDRGRVDRDLVLVVDERQRARRSAAARRCRSASRRRRRRRRRHRVGVVGLGVASPTSTASTSVSSSPTTSSASTQLDVVVESSSSTLGRLGAARPLPSRAPSPRAPSPRCRLRGPCSRRLGGGCLRRGGLRAAVLVAAGLVQRPSRGRLRGRTLAAGAFAAGAFGGGAASRRRSSAPVRSSLTRAVVFVVRAAMLTPFKVVLRSGALLRPMSSPPGAIASMRSRIRDKTGSWYHYRTLVSRFASRRSAIATPPLIAVRHVGGVPADGVLGRVRRLDANQRDLKSATQMGATTIPCSSNIGACAPRVVSRPRRRRSRQGTMNAIRNDRTVQVRTRAVRDPRRVDTSRANRSTACP